MKLTKNKTHNCKLNTFHASEVQNKIYMYGMYTYHRVKNKVKYNNSAKMIYYYVYFIDITTIGQR